MSHWQRRRQFRGHLNERFRRSSGDCGFIINSADRDAPHAVRCIRSACGVAQCNAGR